MAVFLIVFYLIILLILITLTIMCFAENKIKIGIMYLLFCTFIMYCLFFNLSLLVWPFHI